MSDHRLAEATEIISEFKNSTLIAAAMASALSDERASTPREALEIDVPRAAVLNTLPDVQSILGSLWGDRRSRGNNLVSSLSQAAAAAAGTTQIWSDLSDDVMIAQGRSSVLMANVLLTAVAPAYATLGAGSSAHILDVGTGIGAIATALATALPGVEVTGIDIAERPLQIGRVLLRDVEPSIAERVHLHNGDVTELADEDHYDVVWMPIPFLPDAIVGSALDRATRALRPDGLLVLGTNPDVHDERQRVTNDWIASLTGGGTLTTSAIERDLAERGYRRIARFGTVAGGPVLVAAVAPL
jgi:SAM-dependent methyltransferase